jgi:hypothetical protein
MKEMKTQNSMQMPITNLPPRTTNDKYCDDINSQNLSNGNHSELDVYFDRHGLLKQY